MQLACSTSKGGVTSLKSQGHQLLQFSSSSRAQTEYPPCENGDKAFWASSRSSVHVLVGTGRKRMPRVRHGGHEAAAGAAAAATRYGAPRPPPGVLCKSYRCHSMACLDRPGLELGDKIIMPQSAFKEVPRLLHYRTDYMGIRTTV